MEKKSPIVFYDGVCGFCNKTVQFLLAIDRKKQLRFSPIQGKTGTQILKKEDRKDLKSIIFVKNGKQSYRSSAIIQILATVGGVWRLALLAYLIPRFIRDAMYMLIATYRYTLFGKYDTCKRPSQDSLDRFLD